jgi:hypothetical protein
VALNVAVVYHVAVIGLHSDYNVTALYHVTVTVIGAAKGPHYYMCMGAYVFLGIVGALGALLRCEAPIISQLYIISGQYRGFRGFAALLMLQSP